MSVKELLANATKAGAGGTIKALEPITMPAGRAVYLFTSAQNNTKVHAAFWRNLVAYAAHRDAQIKVSRFSYNKSGYARNEGAKPGSANDSDYDSMWYDPVIVPHICDDRLALTKSLLFCGEVNIIPTAEHPLTGFANYTGRASAIFPHAKQQMVSVASSHDTKLTYTTGACTLRNYLQRKAGQKAEYQHAYGALIVEVDEDGDWFVRQIRATENGNFQDLDMVAKGGKITKGHRVEAFQAGDVHVDQLDPNVRDLTWGRGGIVDALRPKYQFMHDTLDFRSRNHHDIKNPYQQFRLWLSGGGDVRKEINRVAQFLAVESFRPFCKTVVVGSNHDAALLRWLREADFKLDPLNAEFYLDAQRRVYEAMRKKTKNFHLLRDLLCEAGADTARYLADDESFVICPASGGIECGMHGHNGANGARGSLYGFARMGRRVNVGHAHSAAISGDAFVAGTSSKLRMSYTTGPSSWSHSHIVTYPNGCRTILTLWNGKYRGY